MMHGMLKRADKMAFVASALYIVGMLVGAAFALYPVVLPSSSDPARNLTIYNTAAGEHGLTVGLTWWILGMILALGYFTLLFRMFKGKVRLGGGRVLRALHWFETRYILQPRHRRSQGR
jgi:cytochrome bd ubiquinol oxidase subunit II